MGVLQPLLEKNKRWAEKIKEINPDFFDKLAQQQSPDYLWIGCSDSRVSANQILDLLPGEVFVHRNIANVVVHSDLNCLSVIQFAIEVLQVKHIIVCGHYGCGGIKAAIGRKEHGLVDNWLRHIRDVHRYHKDEIDKLEDDIEKLNLLCEKNVIEQVANVCASSSVQKAWQENKKLSVHGLIYDVKDGLLKDLDVSVTQAEQLSIAHQINYS